MTLKDLFRYLAYGELSQLALGAVIRQELGPQQDLLKPEYGKDTEEYAEHAQNVQKLITHINVALKTLYRRFFLASKDLILQQYDHIETYTLTRRFAESNTLSPEPYRYIKDSSFEPFLGDVLKIEQVFDEDGRGLYLNDRDEPWSLYTPEYNQIQIPYPCRYNNLLVHYRASHPDVEYEPGDDASQIELKVPEALIEPLLYYIAHRAFSSLNVDGNAEGNNYLTKYEQACVRAERDGMQIHPQYTFDQLRDSGWV